MQQLDSDEVRIHIKARPEHIYGVVSHVTRTPEFSPEILRCTWLDGVTGPAIGASFRGRQQGWLRPCLEAPARDSGSGPRPGVRVRPDREARRHAHIALRI